MLNRCSAGARREAQILNLLHIRGPTKCCSNILNISVEPYRSCNPSSASSAARTALPRHEHIHLVRRLLEAQLKPSSKLSERAQQHTTGSGATPRVPDSTGGPLFSRIRASSSRICKQRHSGKNDIRSEGQTGCSVELKYPLTQRIYPLS